MDGAGEERSEGTGFLLAVRSTPYSGLRARGGRGGAAKGAIARRPRSTTSRTAAVISLAACGALTL
jgi:hypothetical protein